MKNELVAYRHAQNENNKLPIVLKSKMNSDKECLISFTFILNCKPISLNCKIIFI